MAPAKSRRSLIIRLLITLGLLWALFAFVVEPDLVAGEIRTAWRDDRAGLGLAVLLYALLGSFVRGWRWKSLVDGLGHRVSAWRTTELFLVGTFFNQFLPTGMGGDVVRALTLARDGIGRAHAASTVLVDRAIGLLPLLAVGLIALPSVRDHVAPVVGLTLLLVGLAGVVGLAVLLRVDRWMGLLLRLPVLGAIVQRPGIERFLRSFSEYSAGGLGRAAAWGFAFAFLLIGANSALGGALGIDQLELADWAIFVPLVALSTMLPSIGGWGVREMLYAGLLSTLPEPVPREEAVALSILFGGMNLLLAAVGGVLTGMGSAVGLPDVGALQREAEAASDAGAAAGGDRKAG